MNRWLLRRMSRMRKARRKQGGKDRTTTNEQRESMQALHTAAVKEERPKTEVTPKKRGMFVRGKPVETQEKYPWRCSRHGNCALPNQKRGLLINSHYRLPIANRPGLNNDVMVVMTKVTAMTSCNRFFSVAGLAIAGNSDSNVIWFHRRFASV